MRILFIGDIMGRSGREALETYLPQLKDKLSPDVTIVNGENAAHGRGITEKFCKQFYDWGVDCITTGNHVWDQREILSYIKHDPRLLRPLNFPKLTTPGNGLCLLDVSSGHKILVVNLMARLFMNAMDNPFEIMEEVLQDYKLGHNCDAIFVDFHGETTSEKMSFGHNFASRVSAVIGTHTHIPTADSHIMAGGTAYMSDVGMCGDYDSVIGMKKQTAVERFTKMLPGDHFVPANEYKMLCGVLIITDDKTGLADHIAPVRIGDILTETIPSI